MAKEKIDKIKAVNKILMDLRYFERGITKIEKKIHYKQFYQHEWDGNKCSCGYDEEDHAEYYGGF